MKEVHPVHLYLNSGMSLPSSFIPFCGFANDMMDTGMFHGNFTFPVCSAFKPSLLFNQLCYELDISRLKQSVNNREYGGFFVLLDLNTERDIEINTEVFAICVAETFPHIEIAA